jgi:hypothetical protein
LRSTFCVRQLYQDAVGVARRAVLAGSGAGHGGLDHLDHVAHVETEVGDLVAQHPDLLLRDTDLATDVDVGHTGDRGERLAGPAREQCQRVEVEAAHLDRDALLGRQQALEQELPLRCTRADLHAGYPAFQ